ncbi:unnamed protein product [Kuraishia capsulata CBS 1993]|uniref:Uncharacterized protein n=1 Tax=Kuraishia capsulata CBS 1993 TaxID=1382522 RepID=W6MKM6_9ASCO|nr:uncharacterized protein KUCA_T00002923001 [Kuraishia capsulata CBS 1993]CDK26946.1 unnamed protein product [Kuraishia capsulata CBS 1993]
MSDPFEGQDVKFKIGGKEVDPKSLKPHYAIAEVKRDRREVDDEAAQTGDSRDSDSEEKGAKQTENTDSDPFQGKDAKFKIGEQVVSPDWLGRPHFATPGLRKEKDLGNSGGLLFGADHRPTGRK